MQSRYVQIGDTGAWQYQEFRDGLWMDAEEHTITNETDSVTAVWHSLTGRKFFLRIDPNISETFADVIGENGEVIGSASRIYSDGWAVQTRPFGGYVPDEQCIIVAA